MKTKIVLITGATSQIGPFLIEQLLERGFSIHAVTRSEKNIFKQSKFLKWHILSPKNRMNDIIKNVQPTIWINTGPLSLASHWVNTAEKCSIRRILVTSTTGVLTKCNSNNKKEVKSIHNILQDEEVIQNKCSALDISWTIFRPTLVYSNGRDKNISVIISLIKKFKFFPVWNQGKGLRQPIHAEDIAFAIRDSIEAKKTFNKIYVISGGRVLSYKEMVVELFTALNIKPRIINLPFFSLAFAIKCMSLLPRYKYLNSEMIARINDNLNFDHNKATEDFNFMPRKFIAKNIILTDPKRATRHDSHQTSH